MSKNVKLDDLLKEQLQDKRATALYLEEFLADGNIDLFNKALKDLADVQLGGITVLSRAMYGFTIYAFLFKPYCSASCLIRSTKSHDAGISSRKIARASSKRFWLLIRTDPTSTSSKRACIPFRVIIKDGRLTLSIRNYQVGVAQG